MLRRESQESGKLRMGRKELREGQPAENSDGKREGVTGECLGRESGKSTYVHCMNLMKKE